MNKTELAAEIAARAGTDKATVTKVLDGFADIVGTNVKKGDKVTVPGFVSFSRVERKAHKARHPGTGEVIRVKASKAVRITPGLGLKRVVNGEAPVAKATKAPAKKLAQPAAAGKSSTSAPLRKATPTTRPTASKAPAARPAVRPAKNSARRA